MQLLARRLTPRPKIRYFVHQKLVELNIAIPVVVKVLEDGLHVGHVHNVVIVLVLSHLQDEPKQKQIMQHERSAGSDMVITCIIP